MATGNWWNLERVPAPVSVTPIAINLLPGNVANPFNPTTDIFFETAAAGHVRLGVYDAAGHLVRTLVDGQREAGHHVVTWDGRDGAGQAVAA